MRIAVAGLHTECSTYNPVTIPAHAFRQLRGAGLLDDPYFAFLRDYPGTYVPLLHARAVPGVLATEKLRVRTFGTGYFVDLHVQADPEVSLRDAHALSGRVKAAIKEAVPAVFDASIHMEPFESPPGRPAADAPESPLS